ncbi:hypothetical protein [Streptomyces ginkgonis]|uniref:hypothetical protein n=1 Tax=Streptomyces ginkgonis TaxID=1812259 RepID=UPI002176D804|nr:hypothetical protein [Streptomyces ginkgonis]
MAANDKVPGVLNEAGAVRKAAWENRKAARAAHRDAVLVAAGAGMETADIVRLASRVALPGGRIGQPVSRTAVYTLLEQYGHEGKQHWEKAGRPDLEQAEGKLLRTGPAMLAADEEYERRRDRLVDIMWQARGQGHGPASVVAASGMSERLGYDYLDLQAPFERVKQALGPMLEFKDGYDDMPHVALAHRAKTIVVCNEGEIEQRTGEIRYDRTEDEMVERLRAAGFATKKASNGHFVSVIALTGTEDA